MAQKCTNCNGMLSYDKISQKMYCDKCLIFYEIENTEVKQLDNVKVRGKFFYTEIYKCPNCKSEIKMSDTDFGRKCIFCGELTVPVKGNVEASIMEENDYASRMKPDYILPFAVTEEEAREKAKSIWYGVKDKNFKIVSAKPVYLPYALYDISVNNEKLYSNLYGDTHNNLHDKEVEKEIARFEKVPVIVSDKYIDENLFEIEKFNLEYLVEFDENIIARDYAELLSDFSKIESNEKRHIRYAFLKDNITKIPKYKDVWDKYSTHLDYDKDIIYDKVEYALFPFWFVFVEYQNNKFTTLVNGQNGECIGDKADTRNNLYVGASRLSKSNLTFVVFWAIFTATCIFSITLFAAEKIGVGIVPLFGLVLAIGATNFIQQNIKEEKGGSVSLIYNDDFYNEHISKKK